MFNYPWVNITERSWDFSLYRLAEWAEARYPVTPERADDSRICICASDYPVYRRWRKIKGRGYCSGVSGSMLEGEPSRKETNDERRKVSTCRGDSGGQWGKGFGKKRAAAVQKVAGWPHGEDCVCWVSSTQIWIGRGDLTAVPAACKGQNNRWEKIYRNGGKQLQKFFGTIERERENGTSRDKGGIDFFYEGNLHVFILWKKCKKKKRGQEKVCHRDKPKFYGTKFLSL